MLYAIELGWPASGEAVIHSLAQTVGSDLKLRFQQRADGLHVELPPRPPTKYAYTLRVTFQQQETKRLSRFRCERAGSRRAWSHG